VRGDCALVDTLAIAKLPDRPTIYRKVDHETLARLLLSLQSDAGLVRPFVLVVVAP
jgi:hypothetical protein